MDLYNKYMMRASGEKKYQARDGAEAMTFRAFDYFFDKKLMNMARWEAMTDAEKNQVMEKFAQGIPAFNTIN